MSQTRFSTKSPEVANFLSAPSPLDRFKDLSTALAPALEKPDGPAGGGTPVLLRPGTAPEPQADDIRPEADEVSVSVPERSANAVGRPLHGKKPKVEKTFAIDDDIHRTLISISNHEGIRHDRKFSVSYIMNHLLMYALSHVEGTRVIPDGNGDGLVIGKKESVQ